MTIERDLQGRVPFKMRKHTQDGMKTVCVYSLKAVGMHFSAKINFSFTA